MYNFKLSDKITPNFTWGEFVRQPLKELTPEQIKQIRFLAHRLQGVRDVLGRPITITSGFRSKEDNERVGGSPQSYHLKGMAADIQVSGMSPKDVQTALRNWSGGMGAYAFHTHVDTRSEKARW